MTELRLTHPTIDFKVDVRLRQIGDTWLAVADLASTPEMATADREVGWPAAQSPLAPFAC